MGLPFGNQKAASFEQNFGVVDCIKREQKEKSTFRFSRHCIGQNCDAQLVRNSLGRHGLFRLRTTNPSRATTRGSSNIVICGELECRSGSTFRRGLVPEGIPGNWYAQASASAADLYPICGGA